MLANFFQFILIFITFICKSYSYQGYTIDTEGKNVITTNIKGQNGFNSIAITEIGTLIKYKSDSSILSTFKFSNSNILNQGYSKSFICQYKSNNVILTRDKIIFEITFGSNGEVTLSKVVEAPQNIQNLHCNYNANKYIYTYLTDNSKKYNFKASDKSLVTSSSQTNSLLSSSCFLSDTSLVLCINIISEPNTNTNKLTYFYHNSDSSSILTSGEKIFGDIYEIKGVIIKYYSNSEILLCLSAKPQLISDILLKCSMLNAGVNSNPKTLSISPQFTTISKIDGSISYCDVANLTDTYLYAAICLSYYYRTTYLLSLFKYNSGSFSPYNSLNDLTLPLLKVSPISIMSFVDNTLGIFYQDIDKDSMILVFYPKCGNSFDNVPLGNTNGCHSIISGAISGGYYYDECTHSFLPNSKIPQGYSIYDLNQFCKIKKITCATSFVLDNFVDGYYKCRDPTIQIEGYYFDNEFKKCDRSCLKCKGPTNELDSNNYCQECNKSNGFYEFRFDGENICLHKDEPKAGYFFDTNSFKKCRKECELCKEYPSDLGANEETNSEKDTKCTKCNTNFWPQVNRTSNCIKNDRGTDIKYYYANNDYKRWDKCTEGCLYCTQYGSSIYDTQCIKKGNEFCDTAKGYYPVQDDNGNIDPNKCFHKDVRYDEYFFDKNDTIFKKCYGYCLQCDNNITCLPNKCKTEEGYYPIEDYRIGCYLYNENSYNYVPNYYFDPNTKLFKRCHEACLLCRQQIDVNENDTQCYQCNNGYGYYILNGSDQSDPDNKKCYHQSREGYYLNTDDNKIHKCPDKCTKCEYTHLYQQVDNDVFCTECNNELGFYQIEFYGGGLEYLRHSTYDSRYMECYTWRIEKLKSDTHYNHQPPDDTLFIGNVFKKCNPACAKCTSIGTSVYDTRCQAKQCKPGYIYVQNNEDICFDSRLLFPLHFKYNDPVLGETYFKPCYLTCKTCSADGTKSINNCIECREGYIMHPNQITNAHNCVFDCLTLANNNYYYLDEDNNDEYICVEKCPDEYPFLQPEKKRCLKSCDTESELKYSKDRICVRQCPEGTNDNIKKECVSKSNECFKSDLESNLILADVNDTNINKLIIDYCHDYSYTSNQINRITNKLKEFNITLYKNEKCVKEFYGEEINFPDLSVCFDDLKNYYELSLNQDLIVMIMNIFRNDSYIRVEYKVFDSLTCEELQLGNCSTKNIFTEIKMERYFSESEILKSQDMYLNKDINVYDRDHPFFTDICYQYDYKGDKDMILEDRVNMYYQDISNICEKKCEPKADFDKRIIKCGCPLKEQFLIEENNEDEKNWKFGVSGISVEVLKCSGKAFKWKYFKENIGSYTSLVLIVAEIPAVIYSIIVGLSNVKLFLIPFMGVNPPKRKTSNNNSENENSSNDKEGKNESDNSNNINNEIINEKNINRISSEQITSKGKIITSQSGNIRFTKDLNDKNSDDSLIRKDILESKQEYVKKKFDIYKDIIDIEDLNDVELYDATNLDKRKFCQFYYQELKNTQPIIYSFFYYTPLTPKFFKILHFIFNTTLCFVFNAFFYSKYYISEKFFYFENSFYWYFRNIYDRIIYTCLCTIILSLILRVLTSSKKKMIMWIKREKDPELFNKEITYMMQRMKINYIIYSSVQGAFMFLFWLYLSTFCIAYKNNEMEWFVTSWICFGIIQIWYFISTFFVTCLRYLGIKCGMESCYNLSLCLAFD